MLIVLTIIGTVTAFAFPRLRTTQTHEAARSARREVTTQIARAKATAMQRACRTTVQFRQATNKVWVESCKIAGGTARDTIGTVSYLNARYAVAFTTTADSLPFGANSLGLGTGAITMTFTRSGYATSLTVSAIGMPTW
jgi:Tfp pilus assembly protein FimT